VALKFDLSSIPENSFIVSAKFSIYAMDSYNFALSTASYGTNNGAKSIYRFTEDWTPTAYYNSDFKVSDGPAYDPVPASTCNNTSIAVWEEFNVTSILKAIIEDNAPNYGMFIKFTEHEPKRQVQYKSSNLSYKKDDTYEYHPKLEITYSTEPVAVNPIIKAGILQSDEYDLSFVNVRGQRIFESKTRDLSCIQTLSKGLAAGLYIVEIRGNKGMFTKRSFVVN